MGLTLTQIVGVSMQCDCPDCNEQLHGQVTMARGARAYVREMFEEKGWACDRGRWLCPQCSEVPHEHAKPIEEAITGPSSE
jgi:hypothetical protein